MTNQAHEQELRQDALETLQRIQRIVEAFEMRHGITEKPIDLSTCELCRLEAAGEIKEKF